MNFRLLHFLIPFAAMASLANAQLITSLKLSRNQYVAGEPVIAIVTITNHAGQDLVFQSDARLPWLDFVVKDRQGDPSTPRGRSNFGAMKIGAGASMSRQVDLSQQFYLTEPGNYSVSAIVRIPGAGGEGSATNRVLFNLNPGRPYWSQKVGIAGKPGEIREFRVLNFNAGQQSQVYAQVIDTRTGVPIRTFPLGDALLLQKPMVTIDRQQRMHVMFLGTPTMWVHCQVDTDGKLVGRDIHQRGAQGEPQLMTFADGTVRVANSVQYDAKAVAEAKAKTRKASERPAGF